MVGSRVILADRHVATDLMLALVAQRASVNPHPTQRKDELHPEAVGPVEHVQLLIHGPIHHGDDGAVDDGGVRPVRVNRDIVEQIGFGQPPEQRN